MNKTYIYGIATFTDGGCKASRNFVDPMAFSRWANAQFRKDEGVIVEEWALMPTGEMALVCEWRA